MNQVLITSIINVRHYSSHPDQDPYIYHRVSRTCDVRHSPTLQLDSPLSYSAQQSFSWTLLLRKCIESTKRGSNRPKLNHRRRLRLGLGGPRISSVAITKQFFRMTFL